MKAAVVHSFDQPLSVEDVPVPDPEQVLDALDAIGQVLDGSAPAPRMVFRLAEIPTTATPKAGVAAIA